MKDQWMAEPEEWDEMTLPHLEEMRIAAHEEIQNIQNQLTDLNRQRRSGEPLDFEQWNEWRQKAKYALLKRRERYSTLITYLKNRRRDDLNVLDAAHTMTAALVAREASAAEWIAMAPEQRNQLVSRCKQAAQLIAGRAES